MKTHVLLTGGIYHPFEQIAEALIDITAPLGLTMFATTDPDAAARRLRDGDVALFTVHALRWRMLDADKYVPFRGQFAYEAPQATRVAIDGYVHGGGGLLALHTASICFDTWPQWGALIGARWRWGTSFHPPPEQAQVSVIANHPIVDGIGNFETVDEIYHDLDQAATSTALLASSGQPQLFVSRYGRGRTCYDSLGHDHEALRQPQHAQILRRAAAWVMGRRDVDVRAIT